MRRYCPLRRCAAMLLCILLFSAIPPARAAEAIDLASEAAILMDAETGQILFEKNSHEALYPASITKIMTGMLALRYLDPADTVTVSKEAVAAVPRDSAHIALCAGEELTVEQALYAIGTVSANDAANVLGEAVSGSMEAFGRLMTAEAEALGTLDTHFTNANGLPDREHFTSAYDMALITAAALKTPGFTQYFSTKTYDLPATNLFQARHFANKNRFISGELPYEGVVMSKTGWTASALGTLVTVVQQGDTTLIAVVMKTMNLNDKYSDVCALLDYGFSDFSRVTFSGKNLTEKLKIRGFLPADGQVFSFLVPRGYGAEDVTIRLQDSVLPKCEPMEQITVVCTAEADGVSLPAISLELIRQEPESVILPEPIGDPEIAMVAPPEEAVRSLVPLGLGMAVLSFSAGGLQIRKQKIRKARRRALQRKMRRMRKKMEL